MYSSRTGDGLQRDDTLFGDGWRLLAKDKLLGGGGEVWKTSNG